MAQSLLEDFKSTFARKNDSLAKLIILNVLVFVIVSFVDVIIKLMQLNSQLSFDIFRWLSVPASLHELIYKPWTLVTYMFLHRGFFHLLFNMLWFYWIGQIFQEYLGAKKLMAAYFTGGLVGAITFILAYNLFPLFSNVTSSATAVGASAGVLAIVVGAATLLPDYRIRLLLFGDVPLKYLALASVVLDVLSVAGTNAGGAFAHLGGAAFGFVYIKQLRQGRDLGAWVHQLLSLNERKPKLVKKTTQVGRPPLSKTTVPPDRSKTPTQAEIDLILDKISEKGYDALTAEEKTTLFRAGGRKDS